MKYRIKIVTYKNGRKEYYAQVKVWCGWVALDRSGETDYVVGFICSDRDEALNKIDLHYEGNTKKQSIEFEYINK